MDSVQLAAVLAAVVLVASVISVELGVTVALLELTLGVAAGNLFHLQTHEWLDFIERTRVKRPTERDAIKAAAIPALRRSLLNQLAR